MRADERNRGAITGDASLVQRGECCGCGINVVARQLREDELRRGVAQGPTPIEEPMLLGVTGDGELFYVGIPTEGESAGEVEQNNGWLADLPDARWPLTLLVPGSGVTEDGS